MKRLITWMAAGLLPWIILSATASPVGARTYDLTGAKAFSNLCIDPADDDTSGLRIYVRRPGQTPRVVAQYAEGALDAPIEAPSRVIDGRLRFVVPGDVPEATFTGVVFDTYVEVRGARRGSKPFRLDLARGRSLPRCR